MTSVLWVHTDRVTFEGWAQARPSLALPEELRPAGEAPTRTAVPPVVAASLALHGCADVAVTIRLTRPEDETFGCFGVSGDLAAGLVRCGKEVEIGLFDRTDLVDQVVALVPLAGEGLRVQVTVLGAEAAVAGWQQLLVAGSGQWRRTRPDADPDRLFPVSDVRRELAADLRLALAEGRAGSTGRG